MVPGRIWALTVATMVSFSANQLLCRMALKQTGLDATSYTLARLVSGAVMLVLINRLRRRRHLQLEIEPDFVGISELNIRKRFFLKTRQLCRHAVSAWEQSRNTVSAGFVRNDGRRHSGGVIRRCDRYTGQHSGARICNDSAYSC